MLRSLLIIFILLVAVFGGGGWWLPDQASVTRDVVIERPPQEVYDLLNGFVRFNEWSPWRDYDPTATYAFEGPAQGVGAIMRWRGEKGVGAQEIIALDPPHSIALKLDFGPDGGAIAHYLLRPAGRGTRVVWRLESDAQGALLGRWFNLLLDRMVGPDFERGLSDLKVLAEAAPVTVPAPPVDAAPEEAGADQPEAEQPEPAAAGA